MAVQTFKAITANGERMANWLVDLGITTVAMESTELDWIPVYEILESHGLHVVLVNARDARAVPRRKADVNDAQWIQCRHAYSCRISGGKPLSAHTCNTKNRVTAHLRLAAVTIGKTNTALGDAPSHATGPGARRA